MRWNQFQMIISPCMWIFTVLTLSNNWMFINEKQGPEWVLKRRTDFNDKDRHLGTQTHFSAPMYLLLGFSKKWVPNTETGNKQPKKILISFYLFSEGRVQSRDRPRKSSEEGESGWGCGRWGLYRGQWQAALKCTPWLYWLFWNKSYVGNSQCKKRTLWPPFVSRKLEISLSCNGYLSCTERERGILISMDRELGAEKFAWTNLLLFTTLLPLPKFCSVFHTNWRPKQEFSLCSQILIDVLSLLFPENTIKTTYISYFYGSHFHYWVLGACS